GYSSLRGLAVVYYDRKAKTLLLIIVREESHRPLGTVNDRKEIKTKGDRALEARARLYDLRCAVELLAIDAIRRDRLPGIRRRADERRDREIDGPGWRIRLEDLMDEGAGSALFYVLCVRHGPCIHFCALSSVLQNRHVIML